MLDYLFGTAGFMPHGMCLLWRPDIVAMHVGADMLTFLSYTAIAVSIQRFVNRRPEFRYNRAALLSAAFVGGCGITHLFGAVALWWPAYGAQGFLKLTVALISIAAAITIWRTIPHLASYPTLSEIEARRATEVQLRQREIELNEALDHLKVSNKTKANFLAAMSHDLRTPLNAIIGFSETLKLGVFGALANAKQTEYINHIRSSGEQLLTLINDLLDLSGIESGKQRLTLETLPAGPLLREIVEQFEVSSASQKRHVRVTLHCTTDTLYADEVSFRRMLNNLLANAAKYGGRSGEVSVLIEQNEDGIDVSVIDDGPGFPVGNIEAMRAPFARENSSDDGIGIGLTIVDTLMQQHDGEMVLSNQRGRGARITLRFPPPPPSIIPAEPWLPGISSGGHVRSSKISYA